MSRNHASPKLGSVICVECIESPQRDWWVVADGMSILTLGTTVRSRAFDHLEDLSRLRSTCCRFIPRDGPADWEGDE